METMEKDGMDSQHWRRKGCDLVPSKSIDSGIQIHIGSEDFILLNGYNKDGPADIHSTSDRILCDADNPFYNTVADKASFPLEEPKRTEGHILVIILMAPIYAIDSFVGLLDIQGSEAFFTFLDAVKECYEAFVIAKFLALMYSYLNISISKNIVPDEIKGREVHHSFPMTLFQPHSVKLNHHTLKLLKYWTWQFVIIRPVCSVLMIALELLGWYTSWISWAFTIILNISVSLALYALVVFYHVFTKELALHKPLAKFLCIKGIVFFCFWQGVVLEALTTAGIIRSHHFWLDVEHIQVALQNVLVILEMVIFSVIQQYAYPVTPYTGAIEEKPKHD
ncbi:hypothetical protein J5N97_011974 [Dioscorea zingiberensis]|uniref:Transmembrane protein 184C n=1 Tax=Dioscorea zingiberensis TaxID=325984 RepID=A0A9D5HP08_9LILI|nr:hypothetical protein J5N97_011974 [Dioscorea zingiberensis]